MMALKCLTFTLLCLFLLYLVKSDEVKNDTGYNTQIQDILNYLNSKSGIYLYKTADLQNAAHNQDSDQTIFNFNVQVECRSESQELCTHTEFSCTSTLDSTLTLIENSVDCMSISASAAPEMTAAPVQEFIPIRRRPFVCAGCPVDLNPSVQGIEVFTDAAVKMVESESEHRQKLITVLRVQRQVMATIPAYVKYILNIEVAETSCSKVTEAPIEECGFSESRTCEVEFHDEPQLSRTKHIVRNNCTSIQDFRTESAVDSLNIHGVDQARHSGNNDMENEIDVTYDFQKSSDKPDYKEPNRETPNYDAIAKNGNADDILKWTDPKYRGEVSPSKIEDIESQIIYKSHPVVSSPVPLQVTTDSIVVKEEIKKDQHTESNLFTSTVPSDTGKQMAVDGLLDLFDFDPAPKIHKATQSELNLEAQQTKPIVEELIIPVKATVRVENQSTAPKIDTVIIGVEGSDATIEKVLKKDSKEDRLVVDSAQSSEESSEEQKTASSRKKRDLNGFKMQMEQTSEDEKEFVEGLADLATTTLDNIDADNRRRIVLKILNSKKVHSDGIVYYLTLKVAVSECSEENFSDEEQSQLKIGTKHELDEKCRRKLLNDMTMICKVQIHVTEQKTEPKVIKSQCQALQKSTERSNRTGGRFKRQRIVGAPKNINENDEYFKIYAPEVLMKLDGESEEPNQLKIIKVKSATLQIVSGILIEMELEIGLSELPKGDPASYSDRNNAKLLDDPKPKICNVSIWDQPWRHDGRKTTINCNEKTSRRKRSVPVQSRFKRHQSLGSPEKLDENDDYFQKLVHKTIIKLDGESNEQNQLKIIEVKNPTRQIVSGTLVKMEIVVGLSEIPKGNPASLSDRKEAKLLDDPKLKTCSVSIWDRPWIPSGRQITATCNEKKSADNDYDKITKLFKRFIIQHGKVYRTKAEYVERFDTFKRNLIKIEALNKNEMGTAKYGPTMFADMTEKEYKRYLGLNMDLGHENHIPFPKAVIPDVSNLPTGFDWRDKGVVTPVKNQGLCGSCWAFSVTGNVEGQYAIKTGKLLELSEQELVDCDKLDSGCEGGLPDNAYRAIEEIGGLETESDYPYDAADEKCHFNASLSKVHVTGAVNISSNETEMASWLIANGPISIGINANAMQFYMGGVSHPWKALCNPENLDHGVLIVGYGIKKYPIFKKTMPYWIIKNSWGPRWGEQGYYRVYRGDGTCGVNKMASSATVEN